MNMRRILSGIAALLMCAAVMTGCGSDSSSTAESSVSESSAAAPKADIEGGESSSESSEDILTEESEESSEAAGSSETETVNIGSDELGFQKIDPDAPELEEPTALAITYLDAMKNADADKMLDLMNLDEMLEKSMQAAEQAGQKPETTKEEMMQEFRNMLTETADQIESYEIIGVYEVPELEQEIQKTLDEMDEELEEAKKDATPEEVANYEQQYQMMKELLSFEKLYLFDTDLVTRDGKEENPVVVLKVNGEWRIDGVLMPSMVGYVKKSKITSANSSAKSIYTACMAAVTDMDTEDKDIKLLNGEYEWNGSDFEGLKQPTSDFGTADEAKAELMYRISVYFSDITRLEKIKISMKDGIVNAVAVQNGTFTTIREGEQTCFGSYPLMRTADDSSAGMTLDEVLKAAKDQQ